MQHAHKKQKLLKWTDTHFELFEGKGQSGAGAVQELRPGQVRVGSAESMRSYPGIKKLNMRELDILMNMCPIVPQTPGMLIDLSQSVGRNRSSSSSPVVDAAHGKSSTSSIDGDQDMSIVSHATTPSGVVFHTGLARPLLGVEKLRLQGIFVDDLKGFSDHILSSLVGSAFSSPCCAAAVLALFSVMPKMTTL